MKKIKLITNQILQSLEKEDHTLFFVIMIQASTSDAVPEEVTTFLKSTDYQSPVAQLIPLIVQGQALGGIVKADPITLAVSYFSFIQGLAINRLQWAECPIPEAEWLMKIFK